MSGDRDALAGEYVLGTLRGAARDEFAARLAREPDLAEAVAGWEQRLNPVAQSLPSAKLPPDLWARIERGIAMSDAFAGTQTVRAGEGEWLPLGRGAWIKPLHLDEQAGTRSLLLRLDPGGLVPSHEHVSTEECLVLEGEMIISGVRFGVGDYHVAQPGAVHGDLTSGSGGLIFIRTGVQQPRP